MKKFPYPRIVIVGTTSSGKSTLAKELSNQFGLDYIELDALHWEPNWKEAPNEVFRERVDQATRAERWVVAGNYQIVRDLVWPRAKAIIWLDYSFSRVFWQLTVRTFRRGVLGEEFVHGNRERLWWHLKFWSDESLYNWLFKTYWRRKREYPLLFGEPDNAHLVIIRFSSPREADEWLTKFQNSQAD